MNLVLFCMLFPKKKKKKELYHTLIFFCFFYFYFHCSENKNHFFPPHSLSAYFIFVFLWILILFPQVCLYSYVFNYFSFPWGFNCRLYLQKGAIVIKSLLMTIIWYWFSVLIPDFFFFFNFLIYLQVHNRKLMTQCGKRF